MSAEELLYELQSSGARLTCKGDRLRIEAPEGTLTPCLLERLAQHKLELLRLLGSGQAKKQKPSYGRIVAEYRLAGNDNWLPIIAAPGQTYEQLVEDLQRRFQDLVDVRIYRRGSV